MTTHPLPLTEHKRNVLRAWLDGQTIQTRNTVRDGDNWRDYPGSVPLEFNLDDNCYRIKPTPTRRFWKPVEIPIGWQVRHTSSSIRGFILFAHSSDLVSTTGVPDIRPSNFHEFEVAPPGPANAVQWQPAGVEE